MPSRGLIVFALALIASGCQPPMQDFTSQKWKFKARFPGKPDEKTQPGPQGITMTMFMVESRNGATGIGIADMPFPDDMPQAQIDGALDGAQDGIIRNGKGTLKSSNKITSKQPLP